MVNSKTKLLGILNLEEAKQNTKTNKPKHDKHENWQKLFLN